MGSKIAGVVLLMVVVLIAAWLVMGRTSEGFRANSRAWGTYHFYDELGTGDGSPYNATACADVRVSRVALKKHPWIAINPPSFGLSNDGDIFRRSTCGTCVEVTRKNGRKQIFRVVDIKGEKGVDMSQHGFRKLGMTDNEYVSVRAAKC